MVAEPSVTQPVQVRTRRVHYISGFDPRGARFYHRLYREESARQAAHMGAELKVGGRRKLSTDVSAWSVEGSWNGESVQTDYQFMAWDDIVREHWDSSFAQLFRRSIPVYLKYVLHGGFKRVSQVSRPAFYTAVFPMVYLVLIALVALLIAAIGAGASQALFGNLIPGLLAGVVLAGVFAWWGLRAGERIGVLWVLRTCVFVVTWGTRSMPNLRARTREMAEAIVEAQRRHPVDEVLIVGHSIGAIVAVSVTARVLELASGEMLRKTTFITLGQCIPYVSVMPAAEELRNDLKIVADGAALRWVDFTAPPDPLCFFRVDPVRFSGLECALPDRPKQVVVRVFRMFGQETYSRMRLNKLRLHFQYLMASELKADYDFFLMTAGPNAYCRTV